MSHTVLTFSLCPGGPEMSYGAHSLLNRNHTTSAVNDNLTVMYVAAKSSQEFSADFSHTVYPTSQFHRWILTASSH